MREMVAIAHVSHPGIVRLDDAFEQNNTLCFSMQFVEGESLARLLTRRGALSYETVISLGKSLVEAVESLHERDVLHGDIKPGNVLLRPDKSIVLIDFGSAERLSDINYDQLAVSPGYSPLERYSIQGQIGPWSDIYGCAATLTAMLAGKEPPSARDMPEDRAAWLNECISRHIHGDAEAKFRSGVVSALARNPRDRPQSAQKFLESLGLSKEKTTSAVSALFESAAPIFISYSRKDAKTVEDVVKALQLRGVGVWIDRQNIAPGEVWGGEIVRGLRAAQILLLFSSVNSMASAHVIREIYQASQLSKKMMVVRLDDEPYHDDVSLFLNVSQGVRLAESAPEEVAKRAVEMLDRLAHDAKFHNA
jgi:serine/threonine protein kinase